MGWLKALLVLSYGFHLSCIFGYNRPVLGIFGYNQGIIFNTGGYKKV